MGFLKIKAAFMIFVVVMSIFTVYLLKEMQPVVALEPQTCCEKTLGGSFCVYTDAAQCDPQYHQTQASCEQTSYCQPVCCQFPQQGQCYAQVGAAHCTNQAGGVASAGDPSCSHTSGCEKGCCQLGNQCFLSTQQHCTQQASSFPGLDPHNAWSGSVTSEAACVDQCTLQEEGCCVDSQAGCQWTTREQCPTADQGLGSGSTGFHENQFCSSSSLSCECQDHFKKGCLPNQDDVYWIDSCGNPEDVAEDCNYSEGTLCMDDGQGAHCGSVNCATTQKFTSADGRDMNPSDPRNGGFRYNGESWCTYESGTGGFYDRPGSRHYRHVCVNGKELVEECKDFREEICVQSNTDTSLGPLSFSQCKRIDDFPKLDLEEYQKTKDAQQSIVMPGTPDFSNQDKKYISTTSVDKGSKFWEGANKDECAKGKTTCKVVWARKNWLDDWDCAANCNCETEGYLTQAADYCKMFGDCGADVNILGKRTDDGLSVAWKGTSKGPTPTVLPQNSFVKWDVYGIFDGMKSLGDILKGEADNALAGYLGTATKVSAILAVVYLVYAAITGIISISSFYVTIFGTLIASGPWGWIAAVVLLILIVIFGDEIGELLAELLGSDTQDKTITVTCEPWTAPVGGDDCEQCDDDLRYDKNAYPTPVACSEYRCKSLGTACDVVNIGTSNEKCVNKAPNDVVPPVIQPWEEIIPLGHHIAPTGTGYAIQPDLPYWERFSFGIETDEVAQCKWDTVHTATYQEMTHFFGTSLFGTQFNMSFSLPGGQDSTYYVRCSDVNGNANVQEYTIQFSTTDEPDLTPPVIETTSIPTGAYLSANLTSIPLWLELNEPASECWWSKGTDVDRNAVNVSQTFLCGNSLEQPGTPFNFSAGWSTSCVGLLTGLPQGAGQQSQYYFRCTDLANNSMQQGYSYILKGSHPLTITQAGPIGVLYNNDVILSATTSGGAEQGKARCRYAQSALTAFIDFFSTGSSQHTQTLTDLLRGDYTYTIRCEDVAGNAAQTSLHFTVDVDMIPPHIVWVYSVGEAVTLVLNEPATCRYRTDTSTFSFADGTLAGTTTMTHVLAEQSPVYYVQCHDQFDNMMDGVAIYA